MAWFRSWLTSQGKFERTLLTQQKPLLAEVEVEVVSMLVVDMVVAVVPDAFVVPDTAIAVVVEVGPVVEVAAVVPDMAVAIAIAAVLPVAVAIVVVVLAP